MVEVGLGHYCFVEADSSHWTDLTGKDSAVVSLGSVYVLVLLEMVERPLKIG